MKALIFAAGKGTRLKPFTDNHPKALALVNDVPLLERNIKYLQSFGINDFVINIHHFGQQISEFLKKNNNFNSNIELSDEKEELLETGGGLVFAKKFLNHGEDFLIMNADILTDLDLNFFVEYRKEKKDFATLAVSDRRSSRKLLFNPEIFNKMKRTGKFSIMEEYLDLMSDESIHGYEHSATIIDVGRPESITEAEKIFK